MKQEREGHLFRETLDVINDVIEHKMREGEFTPIELSIEEVLGLANLRGLKPSYVMPETDKDFGTYTFGRGEDVLELWTKRKTPENDRAVWVPVEQVDLFKSLFMGSR